MTVIYLFSFVFIYAGERWRTVANNNPGGEGGIRTPDTLASMPHFECGAFNHSATSPIFSHLLLAH
jgi:hypothetical protein